MIRFSSHYVLLLTAFIISCSSGEGDNEVPEGATKIEIAARNAAPGTIYLGGLYGEQYYNVDTFTMNADGQAIISRAQALDQGMYFITLSDQTTNVQILVGPDQEFALSFDAFDVVGTMQVEGSTDNELLYANLLYERQYQQEYQQIRAQQASTPEGTAQFDQLETQRQAKVAERVQHVDDLINNNSNTFFAQFKRAGQNPKLRDIRNPDGSLDERTQMVYYLMDYWDEYDFSDERLLKTPVYHNKLISYFDRLLPQNADTIIKYADMITRRSMANDSVFKYTANYIGVKYEEPIFMGSDAIYTHMVRNFFTHDLAFWATKYEVDRLQQDAAIRYSSQIGQKAKDLTVIAPDGKHVSLLDTDAELLVLYVYTPNCENCQKETPLVKNVYDQWKSRGIEVFALCTDPDENLWKNYITSNGLNWINAFDPSISSNYTFKYHVDVTPEIFVIKDGIIVAKDLKAFQLPTIFERHL